MRPIWNGFISLGLINIPIELYSGEKKTDLSFKLIDSRDQAKIRYERINEETGEEVPWSEVAKAFEYDKNEYVIVGEEDFKKLAVKSSQTIDIEDFIIAKDLDCTYFEKPYYLVPGKRGEKGYVLFRETLRNTGTVAIAKVVIRTFALVNI
jgi:DNA end-binding protein Ku